MVGEEAVSLPPFSLVASVSGSLQEMEQALASTGCWFVLTEEMVKANSFFWVPLPIFHLSSLLMAGH